jgi:CubicO group peptidase (beta-lactamase class C family)
MAPRFRAPRPRGRDYRAGMTRSERGGGRPGRRSFLELAALTGGAALVRGLAGCSSGGGEVPRAGGASAAGLGRLHDRMAAHVGRGVVPGLVTLVRRGGEVHVDAIGVRTIGGTEPMQRDTIFRIASMTKPITAAATMILVDEGKLRVDEPVDRLLPELANRRVLRRIDGPIEDTVPASRPITVHDLLTFTMGFGFLFPLDMYPIQKAAIALDISYEIPRPQSEPPPDEWLRRFATLPLMYQPGERFVYHTGSEVLGVLIARASGQPFDRFLAERIFQPLGMKDTGFSVPADKLSRLPTCYSVNPATGALELFDGITGSEWSRPPAFPSSDGGLVSTIDDYLAFALLLLNRGTHNGRRILSASAVEAMTTDQLTPGQKAAAFQPGYFDNRGWGFGLGMITRTIGPAEPAGQYGWDGAFGTRWINDPERDLVAIFMTQAAVFEGGPGQEFYPAVYEALV